ncbi:hypothetical protein AB9F35_33415, partial [Rhizobium leguminosarum]
FQAAHRAVDHISACIVQGSEAQASINRDADQQQRHDAEGKPYWEKLKTVGAKFRDRSAELQQLDARGDQAGALELSLGDLRTMTKDMGDAIAALIEIQRKG